MAREGIIFVVIPFLIGLTFLLLRIPHFSYIIAIFMYILTGYFAFFFRDPNRPITAKPNEIVSPVDGTVLDVIEGDDNNKIVIFLSLFNVHITRLPYNGRLEKVDYFKGKFLPAFREKASELNERITINVISDKFEYVLRLIAGIAARRIRMWVKQGETLKSGDKIGILMFGSRAELILPKSVELITKKGNRVTGGLTLIGKIVKTK